MRTSALFTAAAFALALATDAVATPTLAKDKAIDIELRGIEVEKVFALLGEVSDTRVTVDPCVHGKVDIRLKNTPVSLVFDALATKMGFAYQEDGSGVVVTCGATGRSLETTRVSLVEHRTPMPEVASHLAREARLDGVDYRASNRPEVSVTLERIRVATAATVLGETSGLSVRIEKRKVVVTD